MIGCFFAGGVLLAGSIYDIKSLCLPLWLLGLGFCGGIVGGVYSWMNEELYWWELLISLVPGVLSLILSFMTREQIGYGDGLVLLMLAGTMGAKGVWHIWIGGLLASFVLSIVLLILHKASRKTRLPFVPFLLLAYVVTVVGGMTGA